MGISARRPPEAGEISRWKTPDWSAGLSSFFHARFSYLVRQVFHIGVPRLLLISTVPGEAGFDWPRGHVIVLIERVSR